MQPTAHDFFGYGFQPIFHAPLEYSEDYLKTEFGEGKRSAGVVEAEGGVGFVGDSLELYPCYNFLIIQ
jgi:hypothetical protein